jgi:hypothetical protein
LSVAANQDSETLPVPAFPISTPGALGGCRSSHGAGKRTNEATDGTPLPLRMKSM